MRTHAKVGLGAGVAALALGGTLLWNFHPTAAQASMAAQTQLTAQVQATSATPSTARPRQKNKQHAAAYGILIKATATAAGLKPHDVITQLRQGQSLAEIAAAHNSSGDKVVQAANATLKTRLDRAVAAGTISQDQENQRLTRFSTEATKVVNDKQLGAQIAQFERRGGRFALIQATMTLTGLTREQVQTDLKSGKSIADIAAAHNSSGDKVVQAVLDKTKTRLDQAVSKGHLSQAQEDARIAKLRTALTAAVAQPGLRGEHAKLTPQPTQQ